MEMMFRFILLTLLSFTFALGAVLTRPVRLGRVTVETRAQEIDGGDFSSRRCVVRF